MRRELKPLWDAIGKADLPNESADLFGDFWDEAEQHSRLQELSLRDFKNHTPDSCSEEMGAVIVRLALDLHNSFDGVMVFGINDRSLG